MASIEKDAIKGLRSLSECCICLTTYTDPRILSCFHTCCFNCFEDIQKKNGKKNGDVLPCPLCRKEFTIPPEGMKGLQKNFFIESVIEMTKALNADTKRITCSICSLVEEAGSVSEAEMRCLNCCENYCHRCTKMHKGQKVTKEHKIVKIKSLYEEEEIRNMFPIRNCHKHSDRVLDFYCSDCKAVVCVYCFVEDHKLHDCKDVATVDKDYRTMIEVNCANISKYSEEMLTKKNDIKNQQKEYLKKLFTAEKAIMKKSQQLKELIDQHLKLLLDELQVMKQRHQKIMEAEIEEIERKVTVIESFVAYCTELKSKGSPSEVCGCVDNLNARSNELSAESDKLLIDLNKSVEIEFVPTDNNALLRDVSNIIGSLSESVRQFDNYAIVIGINRDGSSITNEVVQINLNQTEKVSCLPSIPTKMAVEAAAAVYSNIIFVSGIGNNCDEIWSFDASSSSWKQCASLVRGRRRHCVAFVDHLLFICGGYVDSDKRVLGVVEAYDAIENKCKTVGKLDIAVHSSGNCVLFKAKLYVFGGRDASESEISSIQVYDTKLNTCSLLSTPLPRASSLLRTVLWGNSVILIGRNNCFFYNFDAETFQIRDRFKTDVGHFGLTFAKGIIFVIGGGIGTADAAGNYKWSCRDDVRWIPIVNILNDGAIEWKHHCKLLDSSLVFAFAAIN